MGKFKIGDDVRAIESSGGGAVTKGSIYTVFSVDDDRIYFMNNNGRRDSWRPRFFEPLAAADSNGKDSGFKTGDKARAKESSCGGAVTAGTVYEVTGVFDDKIRFVNDNGRDDSWGAGYFEPTTLRLREGGYYRTRDGRKIGPMVRWNDYSDWPWSDHMTAGSNIWNDSGKNGNEDEDLIAEWQDEPAPATTPATAKFKVGDRVRANDDPPSGEIGTIRAVENDVTYLVEFDTWRCGHDGDIGLPKSGWWLIDEEMDLLPIEAETSGTTPAIVARIHNGQPSPARKPYVHASVADASKEATRLAKANPGREFAVYEMVHTVTEQPQHEWQRLALAGKTADAERELMRFAGVSEWGASNAVMAFR